MPKNDRASKGINDELAKPKVASVREAGAMPSFDDLPDSAWVRQAQLVRDAKHPTRPVPLPFSSATFWRHVKSGSFPKPSRLGARITAWRVSDVRRWLEEQAQG